MIKPLTLSMLALSLATTAWAQAPTFTPNYAFAVSGGTNIAYGAQTFTTPAAGASVTWNYSTLLTSGQGVSTAAINLLPPAQLPAPYNTNYPAGTTFGTYNDESGSAQVVYYKKTADSLIIKRLSATGLAVNYYPGLSEAIFPMTFNQTFNQDFLIDVNGTQLDALQKSTYMGYGTLTLPTGTFTNAICIKGEQTYDIDPTNPAYTYTWYKPGWTFLLRVAQGNSGYAISYTNSSTPTAVEENTTEIKLSVYPNPSNDVVFISTIAAKYHLQVYSTVGALVTEEDVDNVDQKAYPVDLTGLSQGMYVVNVTDAEGHVASKRFIKQ